MEKSSRKVDFFIIGAQKSGTTTLASILASHPQICFCRRKEPAFFNKNDWSNKLEEYFSLFNCEEGQILGEASTMYSFYPEFPDTAANIYRHNPKARLIYLLRNPVERIISHYAHRKVRKREKLSIERAIKENPGYLSISSYYSQLEQYLNYFEKEQIKVVIFERFKREPEKYLMEIADFIEIDKSFFREIKNLPKTNVTINTGYLSDGGKHFLNRPLISKLPYRVRIGLKKLFTGTLDKKPDISAELNNDIKMALQDDQDKLKNFINDQIKEWD